MKKLIAVFIALLAGCATPHNVDLERKRVHGVTVAQLTSHAVTLEEHYWKYAQSEGIHFPPNRSDSSLEKPDSYNNGGDSALFTGYALATFVYKYKVTGEEPDLFSVIRSLRGMYILTHATGTPGAISRCAFPADNPKPWRFPEAWGSRIERGFVGSGPAHQPNGIGWTGFMRSYPSMTYYTRATRDQLTGLLFGLSVAWHELTDLDNDQVVAIRSVVAEISNDLYDHLRAYDFKIRDEKGENMTSADSVTNFMKLQLLALYRLTAPEHKRARAQEKYDDQLRYCLNVGSLEYWNIFSNYSQYYAWNLRHARAFSVWMLEDDDLHKKKMANYIGKWLRGFVEGHDCPFFAYIHASSTGIIKVNKMNSALFNLRSLVLRPLRQLASPLAGDTRMPNILQVIIGSDSQYHLLPHLRKPNNYFTWQKRGWDTGGVGDRPSDNAVLDFLLPYWLGRRMGLVPAK